MSTILCFSGGLDSLAAYYYLEQPKTVYFACTEYDDKEIQAIKSLVPETIIDYSLNFTNEAKGQNAYVPYRNLYFALRAARYGETIVIAGIKDDVVSDKNPEAFNSMEQIMNALDSKEVEIMSPFWNWSKIDIVNYLLNLPNGGDLIEKSTSCYHPTEHYCGACPSCFRKACALWNVGIELKWNNPEMLRDYLVRATKGQYTPERNKSIIKFVNDYTQWEVTPVLMPKKNKIERTNGKRKLETYRNRAL